jgi:chemotaxis protein methyltransferase CheR
MAGVRQRPDHQPDLIFREAHHFEVLADAEGVRRPLRIWCNDASTGEEPYTLAMRGRTRPAGG